VIARRQRAGTQRHRLVVGLVCRRAAKQEDLGGRAALVELAGVVVVDLVIVPRRQPGRGGVRRHQIPIGFVEGVAVAVIHERENPAAVVLPDPIVAAAVGPALVDVVAGVEDEVELLLGDRR
jgi:hypothetical protein